MAYPTSAHCPRCDEQTTLIDVPPLVVHGEILARACVTCRLRFALDGVTFSFARQLPGTT